MKNGALAGIIIISAMMGIVADGRAEMTQEELDKLTSHLSAFDGEAQSVFNVWSGITDDCSFRYSHGGTQSICVRERKAAYRKMQSVYDSATQLQRMVIAVCMEGNKALNNYEWDDIPYCYERLLVEME